MSYIERRAAIEAVRQVVIKGYDTDYGVIDSDVIYEVFEDIPSADVVPVVRCKDCEYSMKWRSEESAKKFGQMYACMKGVFRWPDANDYCSYGKRREE